MSDSQAQRLLVGLRDHLAAHGLARRPRDAGSAPPMWIEPADGVPYPGQTAGLNAPTEVGASMVTALFRATGIVPPVYEGFIRMEHVTLWCRTSYSAGATAAYEWEQEVRDLLNDKRDYFLPSDLQINESMLFRDFSTIDADKQFGYSYNCEYSFHIWQ